MTETLHERSWTHPGRPALSRRGITEPVPDPWDNEPDKVQWIDPATDLDCLAVRNPIGAWCGYVGVPNDHPYYGQPYDDIPVSVHGGLTFAPPATRAPRRATASATSPSPAAPMTFGGSASTAHTPSTSRRTTPP